MARGIVDQLVSNWRAAPPVRVVEIVDDLPCKVYDDTRGLYRRGEAWIVANACTKSEVIETLAHEVVGHHGMRQALGSLWRPFMQAIQSGARGGDPRLNRIRKHVARAYVDQSGQCNLNPIAHSDEMAAALAQLRFSGKSGRLEVARPMRKVAKAAVGQMSREGLYLNSPATFEELEGALVLSEHHLRFGGHFWGVGFLARRWYAAATMAKPWNPKSPPMSLDESESLLKAENARLSSVEDRKAFWPILWGLVCLVLLPICIIAMLSGFVDFLRMIFR